MASEAPSDSTTAIPGPAFRPRRRPSTARPITGNQRQDWLNTKYFLMWGWNPAEMRDGTNSEYFVRLARERGARTVCIDPRMTMSAVSLADEWVPIRPGTDTAMMSAMAHVMITEAPHRPGFRPHPLRRVRRDPDASGVRDGRKL